MCSADRSACLGYSSSSAGDYGTLPSNDQSSHSPPTRNGVDLYCQFPQIDCRACRSAKREPPRDGVSRDCEVAQSRAATPKSDPQRVARREIAWTVSSRHGFSVSATTRDDGECHLNGLRALSRRRVSSASGRYWRAIAASVKTRKGCREQQRRGCACWLVPAQASDAAEHTNGIGQWTRGSDALPK